MPNHIINTIRLTGDREKISELLESVKDNRFGIGFLDFNKVIPMPESLQIETSSSMERGLKAYKEFVDICTFDGANNDMDLLNIPEDKENIFLRMRKDVERGLGTRPSGFPQRSNVRRAKLVRLVNKELGNKVELLWL